MMALVAFGLGEVIGGLMIGQVIDKIGSRKTALVNIVTVILMTGVTIVYINIFKFNWLTFVMTFMWGIQDSSVNTHCFEILGFEFNSIKDPYAVFNML
jgi:predicted MFS family arabinose efflux permease